jgi:DNA modification methylase
MIYGNITYTTNNPLSLSIPQNSIDLVVTKTPSLFIKTKMGIDSAKTINLEDRSRYVKDLVKLTQGISKILKPSGSFLIKINMSDGAELDYLTKLINEKYLKYNGEIVEYFADDLENLQRSERGIEYDRLSKWYHFSKLDPYVDFYKIGNRKNPVWTVDLSSPGYNALDWVSGKYPNVNSEIKPDIAKTMIEAFSKPGNLVFDPFGGTGSVAIEAARAGRNAISNDPNSDIIKLAKLRTLISLGEKFVQTNVKVVDFE